MSYETGLDLTIAGLIVIRLAGFLVSHVHVRQRFALTFGFAS